MKDYEALVARLNLCKEVVDGIRIYFDFTLGQLLLYDLERPQFEETRTRSREFIREMRLSEIKTEPLDSLSEDDTSQNISQSSVDAMGDIRIEAEISMYSCRIKDTVKVTLQFCLWLKYTNLN